MAMSQKQADVPVRKRVLVRLPVELHEAIRRRSQRRLRSVNSEIAVLIKLGLVSELPEEAALAQADALVGGEDVQRISVEYKGDPKRGKS